MFNIRSLILSIALLVSYVSVPVQAVTTEIDEANEDDRINSGTCVVLLHGLARTAASFSSMENALEEVGYKVANVDYSSRDFPIEMLSDLAVSSGLAECGKAIDVTHFVTHSLGGILVRHYLSLNAIDSLGRIVMLAPPNHGSAVVDSLKNVPGVSRFNGPAFLQLGTDENSIPMQLGPITAPTGVIAGTQSVNLFLSIFLDNPDDGKVSVESTRLEGMCAMLTLPVSHPFIMKDETAIAQTLEFLATEKFSLTHAEHFDCSS